MEPEKILAIVISSLGGTGAILALVFRETITQYIRQHVSNASKKQVDTIFITIIVVSILLVVAPIPRIASSESLSDQPVTSQPIQPKTREEAIKDGIIEGGEMVTEWGKDIKQHKEERQNEMIANKKTNWVYQIGGIRDKDAVINDYEKARGFVEVEILKVSKKEYLLFCPSKAETEVEMNDSINTIKEKLSLIEGRFDDNVYVINLPLICKAKHEPVQQKLYFNKRFKEVSCYVCD